VAAVATVMEPPLSACTRAQPSLARLTRGAGDEARATIDDAVQLLSTAEPPLLGNPLIRCIKTLAAMTQESEASWTYAVRAGAHEGVVRVLDAYPDDDDALYVACGGLSLLGTQTDGRWPGHSAAGARAGAVRSVAAVLCKHGVRSTRLLSVAAPALTALMEGDGADWEAARSGHAGMALAAGLAVVLRDTTGVAEQQNCASFAVTAFVVLGRDAACAQEAACGGALLSLAVFLCLCGADVSPDGVLLVVQVFVAMQYIASHAPDALCARAADAGVAALRFALSAHHDSLTLQFRGWHAVMALLRDDVGAQSRAVGAKKAAMAAEAACRLLLHELTCQRDASHAGHREVAGAAGAVAAVLAVLCAHRANSQTASAACDALAGLVSNDTPNRRTALDARPLADVVAVMRTHGNDPNTAFSAVSALDVLTTDQFMLPANAAADEVGAAAAVAKELADAGVLEVTAEALQKHSAPECAKLGFKCFNLLVSICSGKGPVQGGRETLLPGVAARAKRAGVAAALSAMLARTAPPRPTARVTADRLIAALAKVRVCDGCGTAEAPKWMRCSRCMAARFCGEACMRSSWPTHKTVCTPVAAACEDA
jgi:hypothetical protein